MCVCVCVCVFLPCYSFFCFVLKRVIVIIFSSFPWRADVQLAGAVRILCGCHCRPDAADRSAELFFAIAYCFSCPPSYLLIDLGSPTLCILGRPDRVSSARTYRRKRERDRERERERRPEKETDVASSSPRYRMDSVMIPPPLPSVAVLLEP